MTVPLRHQRVLAHIERNLDRRLNLDALSGVASCSKFHFHRQFAAIFGVSVRRYVQLARMKRASHVLAYRQAARVTDVAFDAGYEAPDAFARAFRQIFGQSPSAFREAPAWRRWAAALQPLDAARRAHMTRTFTATDVTIRDTVPIRVAVMSHHGDPATIGETIRRWIAWRRANGLHPRDHASFNILHTDPRTTPPDDQRLDLCVATDRVFAGDAVASGTIPGGRHAVLRVVGGADDLEPAALFLIRDWLPASGEEVAGLPLYCHRLTLFPDVSEHEAIVDLFLPLKRRA